MNGYSDADWLLTELDVFMETGYSLYRADHVVEVPTGFVLEDDPESYFLANY